jgi:putative transposase
VSAKYACIAQHKDRYPIPLMCRELGVSRSAYYAAQRRTHSAHATRDAALGAQIQTLYVQSRGTYGAPRIYHALQQAGEAVSRKRVARLMREAALVGTTRRRWKAHRPVPLASAPNHLARAFAPSATRNRVWVADVTQLAYRGGTAYLAVVLDLASRAVVGWQVTEHALAQLPLDALQAALTRRCPAPGLLHHSDRGVQYQSVAYQQLLARVQAIPSWSGIGNCYDNAVVESFFATLKHECPVTACPTLRLVRLVLFDYLERWYNLRRLHSSLGYVAPLTHEARHTHPECAA